MEASFKKADLLAILRTNLERHQSMFDEVVNGWRKATMELLQSKVDALANGAIGSVTVNIHAPDNHSGDYESVIKMMELSTDEQWTLDDDQFREYVLDDWAWAKAWLMSNKSYGRSTAAYAASKGV